MKMKRYTQHKALYITMISLILIAYACSPASTVSLATTTPRAAVIDTSTSTYTPQPTQTLQPTVTHTQTPSPTLTPLVPDRGQVLFSENFDDLDFPFDVYGPKRIESGVLVLDKTPPGEMANGIYGRIPIPMGATTLVLFKTVGGTEFNIGYHTGDYGTESIRRFSLNSGAGVWDLYNGNAVGRGNFPVTSWRERKLHYDTWHYLSLTRTPEGTIEAKIWKKDNPDEIIEFYRDLGAEWGTLDFTFFVDFTGGSFLIDEYQEVK